MIETERKFLVKSDAYKLEASAQKRIVQGYLSTDPERTIRIRIKGEQGFLTIKGKSNASGLSRMEWEKEITIDDANALLSLCLPGVIDKVRYEIPVGKHVFEVDEFFGENKGLTIAEIELADENESFEKPDWLGDEVSGDERYYNAYLSSRPFSTW
ncbi:MAG: CYTH domain-containing protein [Flavobacterium sp.]